MESKVVATVIDINDAGRKSVGRQLVLLVIDVCSALVEKDADRTDVGGGFDKRLVSAA